MDIKNIIILICIVLVLYFAYVYYKKYIDDKNKPNLLKQEQKEQQEQEQQQQEQQELEQEQQEQQEQEQQEQQEQQELEQQQEQQEQQEQQNDTSCEIDDSENDIIDNYIKSNERPHVFLDVSVNTEKIGRIIIELFDDIVPNTIENFIYLIKNKYNGSKFHRIVKDFIIQGGDYINGDGTGSNSIYGKSFNDENFIVKHDSKYIVSMANSGPNTNGCQFFITLNPSSQLNNKHVAFGKIVGDDSENVVDQLNNVLVDINDKPIADCVISDCGVV